MQLQQQTPPTVTESPDTIPPPPPKVPVSSNTSPQSAGPSPAPPAAQQPASNPLQSQHTCAVTKPLVKMRPYNGKSSALQWWLRFMTFIQLNQMSPHGALLRLPFYLQDAAQVWYETLEAKWKVSLEVVKIAFLDRFKPTSNVNVELMDAKQGPTEEADDFINRVTALIVDRPAEPEIILHAVSRGLRPSLLKRIIQEDCTSLENLRRVATREEVAERFDTAPKQAEPAPTVNAEATPEQNAPREPRWTDARPPAPRPNPTGALCPKCYNIIGKRCFYPNSCPASHQNCVHCNMQGHFKRACPIWQRELKQRGPRSFYGRPGGGNYGTQ